ncbi:type III secretion system inner rod subunit SctI [Erwinia tasmaniensis]|uniref:type III secretion system inner rod subunit SctI n=1 Tax=Erwinia tasmaniensis TaxID=338565 RepID=UPI0005B4FAD8|nr:type III secretion system inner rod subunit SctI [Erwinia tasmaniensis]
MNLKTKFQSNLTQSLPNTLKDNDHTSVFSHNASFSDFVSNTFENSSEHRISFDNVLNKFNQPHESTDNPENLLMLQAYINEYSNYVSMISSVVRKGIGTIETLEKAQ